MTDTTTPREVRVIGIGAGSPRHLTLEAIDAMREVDVFLVADKGDEKRELVEVREALCRTHLAEGSYRFVALPDPRRGPDAERDARQYTDGVLDWHDARAHAWGEVIDALEPGIVVGFLVWGDPAFYDSTIRVVERMRATRDFDVHVVPGISAFQALAAEHGIVLHEIGKPIHITTGRRLEADWSPDAAFVVMLDGSLHCAALREKAPDLVLHWGAYLGLPQQELRSGRLDAVIDDIVDLRARLRAEHGWADLIGASRCRALTPAEAADVVAGLGPDPLSDDDPAPFYDLARRTRRPIGVVLMDQAAVSGIGNIFRAEALFRAGIDPWRPAREVSASDLAFLWADNAALMREGVRLGRIVTTRPEHRPGIPAESAWPEHANYVYQRQGLACLVCGRETIVVEEMAARKLYRCLTCQS